jgi:predicted dehydrogenase
MNKSLRHQLIPELEEYKISCNPSVAIVGYGKMGILHSGILNLLVSGCVKAVVEKSRLLLLGASRILRDVNFYRELEEMLEREEPEIVYVTTPTISHHSIVKTLLEYHVPYIFVEKPPTLNHGELESLLKLSADSKVMVGLQKRFSLPFHHAKKLLEEEAVGEVVQASGTINSSDILSPTNRYDALGVGVLLDLGIHLVDIMNWLLGVESIDSAEGKSLYTVVDDEFKAKLTTKNGKASLEASWSSPEYRLLETRINIQGTDGVLEVSEDHLKLVPGEEKSQKFGCEFFKPDYYKGLPPVNLSDPEYTLESLHLLHCMDNGVEPLTSLEEVSETMELIDEMYGIAHG